MEPFTIHRGKVAILDTANVDTDQIIAKQFLKSIKRTGFGEFLFYDWRYLPSGEPDRNFPLNRPEFSGATILAAKNNFGCGSSREHAVWAVQQYGFKVVIAPRKEAPGGSIPGFADIFRNNSVKNGLLTVELSEGDVDEIFRIVEGTPGTEATVDLGKQTITLHQGNGTSFRFDIDGSVKNRLINGLDDIGLSLKEAPAIDAFEARHDAQLHR